MDDKKLHRCYLSDYPSMGYGEAVTTCWEEKDGSLWAGNGEYATQVNYCPACGYEATRFILI